MAAEICETVYGFDLYGDVSNAPGVVFLGETLDEAQAKTRELIAVLDAFVRPWTTDGSVPQHVEDVEILLADHRVVRGHYDAQLFPRGWWVDVGDDYERIDSEQVRGWREYDRPIVRAGKVTGFMAGEEFATAPTGAKEE